MATSLQFSKAAICIVPLLSTAACKHATPYLEAGAALGVHHDIDATPDQAKRIEGRDNWIQGVFDNRFISFGGGIRNNLDDSGKTKLYTGIRASSMINSFGKQSYVGSVDARLSRCLTESFDVNAGVSVGGATGYKGKLGEERLIGGAVAPIVLGGAGIGYHINHGCTAGDGPSVNIGIGRTPSDNPITAALVSVIIPLNF